MTNVLSEDEMEEIANVYDTITQSRRGKIFNDVPLAVFAVLSALVSSYYSGLIEIISGVFTIAIVIILSRRYARREGYLEGYEIGFDAGMDRAYINERESRGTS